MKLSPLFRTLGVAAITAAAAFPLLTPRALLADDKEALASLFMESGEVRVAGVRGSATIQRNPRAKSGWGVEVVVDNPDDATHAARVAVAVTRSFFNPAGRTSSTPADVFVTVVSVDVPAHQKVTRIIALPAPIGAEMDQSAALAVAKSIAIKKAVDKGQEPPAWASGIEGAPRRSWAVAVRDPKAT